MSKASEKKSYPISKICVLDLLPTNVQIRLFILLWCLAIFGWRNKRNYWMGL